MQVDAGAVRKGLAPRGSPIIRGVGLGDGCQQHAVAGLDGCDHFTKLREFARVPVPDIGDHQHAGSEQADERDEREAGGARWEARQSEGEHGKAEHHGKAHIEEAGAFEVERRGQIQDGQGRQR